MVNGKDEILEKEEPKIVDLFRHIDDRGILDQIFNSDLPFQIKRIYTTISNKAVIRGMHGHQKEWKALYVSKGLIKIVVFPFDAINQKNSMNSNVVNFDEKLLRVFTLSDMKPQLLIVPSRHYHGYTSLDKESRLIILSNLSLEETKKDDYRLDPKFFKKYFEVINR